MLGILGRGPHDATSHRLRLPVGRRSVEAVTALPARPATIGVVVLPDVGGLRPLFDDVALTLAGHGLAVCAIEPFSSIPVEHRRSMTFDDRIAAVAGLRDDEQRENAEAAGAHLVDDHQVGSVFVLGFCIGGYYALKASAHGVCDGAVSFYGMVRTPEPWQGPRHESPLAMAHDMRRSLALFGGRDPWTPEGEIAELRRAWSGRPDCEVVVYADAEHAFAHDASRPSYRAEDAADAWRRAYEWITRS